MSAFWNRSRRRWTGKTASRGLRRARASPLSRLSTNLSTSGLWTVPDGEASLLGGTSVSDNQPRWTPDGTAVGFISGSGAGANVWVQEDRPDAQPRKLTDVGGIKRFYWLMDGKALAYLTDDNALYALSLEEGAAPVHLRDTVDFAASPDGRRYVYVERVDNVYRHFADRFPPPFQP